MSIKFSWFWCPHLELDWFFFFFVRLFLGFLIFKKYNFKWDLRILKSSFLSEGQVFSSRKKRKEDLQGKEQAACEFREDRWVSDPS